MAGLSFLYAFFNLYTLGATGVPTVDEAMVDIDSCMGVLEYLTREYASKPLSTSGVDYSTRTVCRGLSRYNASGIASDF